VASQVVLRGEAGLVSATSVVPVAGEHSLGAATWIKPELYPICSPSFLWPVNVVAMLEVAIVLYATAARSTRCCRPCEAAQLLLRSSRHVLP
jgi:hypothetical protein